MLDRPRGRHSEEVRSAASDDEAGRWRSRPEHSDAVGSVDVPVRRGDMVIGDARMLHATNSNDSSGRRTVITLWFQPDYDNLPLKTQAQMLLK